FSELAGFVRASQASLEDLGAPRILEVVAGGRTEPAPNPMSALRGKIKGMVRPADWDGLGAKAISAATCQAAVSFLNRTVDHSIPAPKFASPSPLGAIAFQWNTPNHRLKVRVISGGFNGCQFQWIRLPDSSECGRGNIDSVI